MKKTLQKMLLVALLAVPWVGSAQNTLTTCQGSATNNYVPLYGYYADEAQNGQMIYPADSLTAMLNMQITEMVFYINSTGYGSGTSAIGNWIVSLGTTTETTLSGINSTISLTEVYNGALTFNSDNTQMTVTFTDGFTYTGGNLLVQFNHPVEADYQDITFSGVSATGASYCYNGQRDFLPKVTFGYSNPPSCVRPNDLVANNVTSDGLTLSWTDNLNTGATYSIDYWIAGGDTNTVTSSSSSYTFTGLDANTLYYFAVKAVCSATDESSVLSSSFRTACGGSTCDLTLQLGSSSSWDSPWSNGATVQLWQDSALFGSYTSSTSVEVCGTSPIVVKYTGASYSYYDSYATITILDGGGVTVYSGGSGDVLTTIATPCPSCIPPAALVATPDSESIALSWTPRSGASQFIIYLNDSIVDDNVSDTSYSFTSLTANTAYTIGVQAVCSSDDSSAIASISTRTTCGQMPIPYTEDFEDIPYNGAWPSCWNLILNHNTDPSVNYNDNHTANGEYSMYMMANGDYNMFASSAVPLAGNNIYVRFWSRLVYGLWIKAGVMTNLNDTSTFIPLVTVSGTNWTEYEFNTANLDPDSTYYVAWIGTGNSAWSALGMVDDIYISEIPSCIRVTNVALEAADQTSLTLSWGSNGNNGAAYTVSYWADGSTDTLTATASDTTVVLNALNANTVYNVIVVANCSSGDAEASPVFTFRTACGDITLPFFDNFDSYDNGYWPPCWHRLRAYGTDPSVNAQFHHSGSQSMFLLAVNDTTLFCTPSAIPTTGNNIYVRYHAFMQWSSYYTENKWIKAGVMTDTSDMSTFIALDSLSYHNFNNVFEEREFNTSTLDPTATYWVAWMYYSTNNGYSYNRGAIDDVYISEIPSCIRVSNITAIATDSASITLSWVDTLNTGATYTITNLTDNQVYDNISDTTYTIDNLTPNTLYNFTISVNCGSENAEAVSYSARTACGAMAIPYTEGFENYSTNAEPTCWTGLNGQAYVRNSSAHGGSNRLDFRGSNSTIAVLPQFAQEVNTLQMTFWTRPEGDYANCGTLSVGYMTNPTIDTTFVELANYDYTEFINGSAQYGERTVMFNAAPDGAYMAFRHNANSNSYYWYVDDITVDVLPNCVPVSLLTVDTVTATEATISWVAAEGQSEWYVKMDNIIYSVNDTTYTITGLGARTQYTAYVAANCNGDTSTWQSIEFTTDCASGSCDLTVDMADSWGDGWNGNAQLNFSQNGTQVGYAKLVSGGAGTATINVCSGIPVTFSWQSGNFDSECSYVIYDGGGSEVYNSENGGVNHSDTILDACPSCIRPANLRVTAMDSSSITYTWDNNDTIAGYLVSFDGEPYYFYNGSSYTAYNLNPNTAYTFGVMALCTATDTSVAATVTGKTSCGAMMIPFTEDFESSTLGAAPSCWTVVIPGNGAPVVSSDAHNGNKGLNLDATSGQYCMIASSMVPLDGDSIYVSFYANVTNGNILTAGVMTNVMDDSTYIPVRSILGSGDGWHLYDFNTAALDHDSTYFVVFRYYGNSLYGTGADIDDINIRVDEGCAYPTNLVATPVSGGANLSWHNGGSVNNFVVEYRTGNDPWSAPSSTTDTTYSLSNLDASTNYNVRVGLICNNDTLWVGTSFQTPCGLMSVPYFEDFDSYAEHVLPPCWSIAIPGTSLSTNSGVTHFDGGLFFRSNNGGAANYAVVPELDGAITKLKVEFDAKVGTIAEQDGILIGVADAAGTLIAWLDTIRDANFSRNAHVHKTVYFPTYNIPSGAARVAFAQLRNWNEWALIDNISIDVLPDCYPVDNVVGHNLIDPEATYFTWQRVGVETEWQVYVDTVTVGLDSIDNIPASNYITVYDSNYTIPVGMIQGGGIYNFFVRANCGISQSTWEKVEFGAGTVIMNNSTAADTVTGCGFVVYDNGGPIAGYLPNSNSALVIRTDNAGSQLEVFGGKFGWGSSPATLTVYDGEGTNGTVLYTYNTTDGRDTLLNTILATSTTGSLTITFSTSGNMCHTGYELYVRCTGQALCPRPTELQGTMTSETTADVSWNGTAASYNFYYRLSGATTWNRQSVNANNISLTGLVTDTLYDMYVVAICSATDSSTASAIRQLNTHYGTPQPNCDPVTNLQVSYITPTSATLTWIAPSNQNRWEINYGEGLSVESTSTTYTLIGLTPATTYTVKVRALCSDELSSDWSNDVVFSTDPAEGIDDVFSAHISLYPNPASTTVTLSGIEDKATVSVVDMNGREVVKYEIQNSKFEFDVSSLTSGAYFVRIVGEQVNAIRKLIIR